MGDPPEFRVAPTDVLLPPDREPGGHDMKASSNSPDVHLSVDHSRGDRDQPQVEKVVPVPAGEKNYVFNPGICRYTDESRSTIFSTGTVFVYTIKEMTVINKITPLHYWVPENQLPPEAENPPLYQE